MNSGDKLKKRRESYNLSLRALSQMTGISKATLSRYENNGLENAPMEKITIISNVLDTSPDYLLGTDPVENRKFSNLFSFLKEVENNPDKLSKKFTKYFDDVHIFLETIDEFERRFDRVSKLRNKLLMLNDEDFKTVKKIVDILSFNEQKENPGFGNNIIKFMELYEEGSKDIKEKNRNKVVHTSSFKE